MYAKQYRKEFETILQGFLYDEGKRVIEQLEKESKSLLNKTLEQRRSESGFDNAEPRLLDRSVEKNATGITANFTVQVVDRASGQPHKIWHIVSAGVPNRVNKRTYVYPIINEARTTPRKLEVEGYKGFGGFRTAVKGRVKKGFKGRKFYSTAVLELRKLIQNMTINENQLVKISIQTSED